MSLFIKMISLYKPINFLAILYPISLANLVVEVGTRHSHQILLILDKVLFVLIIDFNCVKHMFSFSLCIVIYSMLYIIRDTGSSAHAKYYINSLLAGRCDLRWIPESTFWLSYSNLCYSLWYRCLNSRSPQQNGWYFANNFCKKQGFF